MQKEILPRRDILGGNVRLWHTAILHDDQGSDLQKKRRSPYRENRLWFFYKSDIIYHSNWYMSRICNVRKKNTINKKKRLEIKESYHLY